MNSFSTRKGGRRGLPPFPSFRAFRVEKLTAPYYCRITPDGEEIAGIGAVLSFWDGLSDAETETDDFVRDADNGSPIIRPSLVICGIVFCSKN